MPAVGIGGGCAAPIGQRSVRPSAIFTLEIPTFTGAAREIRLRFSKFIPTRQSGARGRLTIDWGELGHENAVGTNNIVVVDGVQQRGGGPNLNTYELHDNFKTQVTAAQSGSTYVIKVYGQFDHIRFFTDTYLRQWLTKAEIGPARMKYGTFNFQNCAALKSVKIARDSFDGHTTSFRRMFYGCYNLGKDGAEVDIAELTTNKATSMTQMFYACSQLQDTQLDLNRWKLQNMRVISGMFAAAGSGLNILMENWRLPRLTSAVSMFRSSGLKNYLLTRIYINWDANYLQSDANRSESAVFDWGSSRYTNSGILPKSRLVNNGQWSFFDGGSVNAF